MADSQPRKVGEYERPLHTLSVSGIVIGVLAVIALIILAIIFF
jgi:hypothetical protein